MKFARTWSNTWLPLAANVDLPSERETKKRHPDASLLFRIANRTTFPSEPLGMDGALPTRS